MKHKTVYGTMRRSVRALRRLTPRKLANLLAMIRDMKLRSPITRSRPPFMRLNAYPYCNLKCPGCSLGCQNAGVMPRTRQEPVMHIDGFRRCVDVLYETLLRIVLYDEGEPLLHPEIFEMVRYADWRGISVTISSNLSMTLSDERVAELVMSGLDRLIIAMDGTDQETYARYRVGGSLERVQDNLKRVVEMKRRCGRKYPELELQFLNFGYNEHQLPEARRFAKEVGTDVFYAFSASPDHYPEELLFGGTETERIMHGCYHLWAVADVNSAGELVPCDFGEDRNMPAVGSLMTDDFDQLWNGPEMVNLRQAFGRDSVKLGSEFCRTCMLTAAPPPILR